MVVAAPHPPQRNKKPDLKYTIKSFEDGYNYTIFLYLFSAYRFDLVFSFDCSENGDKEVLKCVYAIGNT